MLMTLMWLLLFSGVIFFLFYYGSKEKKKLRERGPLYRESTEAEKQELREKPIVKKAPRRVEELVRRNDKCHCGSGKKIKHCCDNGKYEQDGMLLVRTDILEQSKNKK